MLGKTQICNMALGMLGESPIASLTQENNNARACDLFYEEVRRQLLRSHDWNFAACAAPLALTNEHVPGWEYVYAYPQRCLFARGVFCEDAPHAAQEFEEVTIDPLPQRFSGGKRICCNIPRAWVRYTRDTDLSEGADPLFVRALAAKLAEEIALPITAKTELAQLANQKYLAAMDEARIANKWEGNVAAKQFSPILEAR